jgi:hypothetical protein
MQAAARGQAQTSPRAEGARWAGRLRLRLRLRPPARGQCSELGGSLGGSLGAIGSARRLPRLRRPPLALGEALPASAKVVGGGNRPQATSHRRLATGHWPLATSQARVLELAACNAADPHCACWLGLGLG